MPARTARFGYCLCSALLCFALPARSWKYNVTSLSDPRLPVSPLRCSNLFRAPLSALSLLLFNLMVWFGLDSAVSVDS